MARMVAMGWARIGRIVALSFVTATLIAACSSATPTPLPLGQERIFLPDTVAQHAPPGWQLFETKLQIGIPYGGPIYLSNQPLPDPCAGSTEEAISCVPFPPQVQLDPGGVIVGFDYARELLGVAFPEPSGAGDIVTVNGFRTKLVRDTPGVCGPLGADETVTLLIPSIADWTGRTTVEACLRGPNLAGNEAKLMAMVEAATAK
jgi:hypothetical protein